MNAITITKNTLQGINRTVDEVEDQISNSEDKEAETPIQNSKKKQESKI